MNASSAFCWETHFLREGTVSLLLSRYLAPPGVDADWAKPEQCMACLTLLVNIASLPSQTQTPDSLLFLFCSSVHFGSFCAALTIHGIGIFSILPAYNAS